jgi:hypothetical protein
VPLQQNSENSYGIFGMRLASAHRAFMGLKEIVTGKDEQAIVNEVERGEDVIIFYRQHNVAAVRIKRVSGREINAARIRSYLFSLRSTSN